jgi:murein DD-endopeptidase MepM/ murein hydrolase activator NlpD
MGRVIAWAVGGLVAVIVLVGAAAASIIPNLFAGQGGACSGVAEPETAPAGLTSEQTSNAAVIIATGQQMQVPPRGWVIAIATALQESNLINLDHQGADNDHDSLGLFQQRPSMGWGSPEQIMDPAYASRAFYQRLLQVEGWEQLPLTEAAQQVQRSAFPDAYARHEPRATEIVDAFRTGAVPGCNPPPVSAHGWARPVNGPLTSGVRTNERPDHDGVDIAAPHGTVIHAAAAGEVIWVACNIAGRTQLPTGDPMPCDEEGYPGLGGCGWYLEILHNDPQAGDVVTRYCHLLEQPPVEVGQTVAAAEPIGLVGNSGNSSGPHLHLEVHLGPSASVVTATDPVPFFAARGVPL